MPSITRAPDDGRFHELHRYAILDTEPEAAFDRIVRLTQALFDVPFVLITFLDRERQWFKAAYGVEGRQTGLDSSFCVYTVQGDGVLVVPDATKDPRFAAMPVVTGSPYYRFYAGAPLTTPNGTKLGTLCILDRVPREGFGAEPQKTLTDLAAMVVSELELRVAASAESQAQLERLGLLLAGVTRVVRHERDEQLRVTRLKDELFAKMSHEIRTPLTAIIGFAELLGDDAAPLSTPEQHDYLNIISAAGQHLLTLTSDLLDLAKLEADKLELFPTEFDARTLAENAVATFRGQLRGKRLGLRARLPEAATPLRADPRKLKQVLYNLVSNAVKYTPDGGRVEVAVTGGPHEVVFEVHDTGPGIRPEDQSRLFKPFVQLKSAANSEFTGTGLGLTLVEQLVKLHGGRVWLRSRVGEGSTFGFALPRSGAAVRAAARAHPS